MHVESPFTPLRVIGLARLMGDAFQGKDLLPLAREMQARLQQDPADWGAAMDLATLYMILGNVTAGIALQNHVLAHHHCFREEVGKSNGFRLLALAAPGDFMSNTPLHFMLQGSGIELDILYVTGISPLPEEMTGYDAVIVIAGESDANHAILKRITEYVAGLDKIPVLNRPERVGHLTREEVSRALSNAAGVHCPQTLRTDADTLAHLAQGEVAIEHLLDGAAFPIIARPVDSHAGKGLEKLLSAQEIVPYQTQFPSKFYYIAPFVDYSSPDGLFRKYRIAMINGRPFVCHMAISSHWMIHYLNAGMRESAEKREMEAQAFASFDEDFAQRHSDAFNSLQQRIGLDYFVMDCAETRSGDLLIFEIDTAMIVHAMDPHDLFPYKRQQMQRIFEAFQAMLLGHRRPDR